MQILRFAQNDTSSPAKRVILSEAKNLLFLARREEIRE
jgi:hypothetical protein